MQTQTRTPKQQMIGLLATAVLLGIFALAMLAWIMADRSTGGSSSHPDNSSQCETAWQAHESAANRLGYPAGDQDAFMNSCEQGDASIASVGR